MTVERPPNPCSADGPFENPVRPGSSLSAGISLRSNTAGCFFQLAAPEDPVRQLFSALGFIDAPQSFQSRQRLILRQAQKIQQLTADQSVISRSGLRSLFRRISFVKVRSPEVISRSYVP